MGSSRQSCAGVVIRPGTTAIGQGRTQRHTIEFNRQCFVSPGCAIENQRLIAGHKVACRDAGIRANAGDGRCAGVDGDAVGHRQAAGVVRRVPCCRRHLVGAAVGQRRAGVVKGPGAATVGRGRTLGDAVYEDFDGAVGLCRTQEQQRLVAGDVFANDAGITRNIGDHWRRRRQCVGHIDCRHAGRGDNAGQISGCERERAIAGRQ